MANRSDNVTQPLDLVILGMLSREKMHGYELHKRIIEAFGSLLRPSWGSLYPALQRLETRGDLDATEGDKIAPLIPVGGSLGAELALYHQSKVDGPKGRGRKVYWVTDSGRQRLSESLEQVDVEDDKIFWVTLYLATLIRKTKRTALFTKRLYLLEDRLTEIRKTKKAANEEFESLALEGMEHRLQSELLWLNDIATKEESGELEAKTNLVNSPFEKGLISGG